MKNVLLATLVFVVLLTACSEEEKKLKLFSPDAFAFQLEEGWELNASVQVTGFTLEESNEDYIARLSYYINIITPSGELLEEIISDLITKDLDEEVSDLTIDAQVEMDSSFSMGTYKLIFYVTDDYTGQETSIEKTFVLE